MVRETWYRHLAIADRLMVEARDCLEGHKQYLAGLEHGGQEAGKALALLSLLEETLHLMHRHRATILEKVAADQTLETNQNFDGRVEDGHKWSDYLPPA